MVCSNGMAGYADGVPYVTILTEPSPTCTTRYGLAVAWSSADALRSTLEA
jgi:hypothetical protein